MLKSSDSDINTSAIQQSLSFWRPSSPTPVLHEAPASKAAKSTASNLDTNPRPWRYVRWRKAHRQFAHQVDVKKVSRGNFYYKVLPDEDLLQVAEKNATYPEVVMEANSILSPFNIVTGQILWIPRTHSIQWGNTLWSLSRTYGVPVHTIQNANGIANPDLIYAGDVLVVPEEPDNRNAR